ncbi:MAG: DegT/DnrJ/EryC1/StrS family aminotransferase [Verrucomicrobiae bacterium]|nr:DegT/DnrJ/EryC1/StrS family aminotransferase [Verrucomicrobiae bacterium]
MIEDAAECLGATYRGRFAGSVGDIGVYSFNGNKVITGGGGGMLISKRSDWVEKARFWSTQARDVDPEGLHNYVHSEVGYNYRMSNVLAAIVLGQLDVLEERIQKRRAVAFRYRDAFADLPGISLMPQAPGRFHTNWLSCFLIDEREFGMTAADLIRFLDAANVEARPVWKPMHLQPVYEKYECVGGRIAEDLHQRGLCLPSSSCLTEEQQQFVIDRVREAFLLVR